MRKLETETGVMQQQAKECSEPRASERPTEGSPPEPSEGAQPWRHPDFGPLTPSNNKGIHF